VVESCFFHDVSGAAVQIGSFTDPLGASSDTGSTVRNSIVNKAGAEYSGAAGINVGYTQHVTLTHNDVSNMSYVPISTGWGWSRHECASCTNAGWNTISFNRAHDYKQTLSVSSSLPIPLPWPPLHLLRPMKRSISRQYEHTHLQLNRLYSTPRAIQ
jgi:hypothetical protein